MLGNNKNLKPLPTGRNKRCQGLLIIATLWLAIGLFSNTQIAEAALCMLPTPHKITIHQQTNGTITPSGDVLGELCVADNADQTFTIIPDSGYEVESIVTDEGSQPVAGSYTFFNVTTIHWITATFKKTNYNLTTSQVGNGTVTANTTYVYDDGLAVNAVPDPGWEFENWTGLGSSNLDDPSAANTNINIPTYSDTDITANFAKINYTLTISVATGSGSVSPATGTTYVYDEALVVSATPDPGWEFVNWSGESAKLQDATASSTNIINPMDADTNVQANFTTVDYQITATAGAGGSIAPGGVIAPVNVLSADQVFTITADPGYAVADVLVNGASVGAVASYTFVTGSITSDQTIDASFVVIDYQITATAGVGGSIAPGGVIAPVNVLSPDQVFTITVDPGYAIADVLVNGASVGAVASYTFVTGSITSDQTIDASFVVVDYQITATAGVGGSIAPSGVISPVNVLSPDQAFTITVDPGYAIADVLVNGASVGAVASYTFVTGSITSDQTIDASFVVVDYQITATAGAGGSIAPSGVIAPVNVLSADQVFTITPDAGYAIADVLVNGASAGAVASYTFVTGSITLDQTIDASFVVVDYQITATAGAGGSIAPSGVISPVNVLSADQVFTITVDPGYAIADVLVNGASVGAVASYTFATGSITSDQTIDASFVVVDYQITATAGAGGSIAPSGVIAPVNVLSADQVFTITPDAGYAIADVLVNGASAGAVASYTFVTGSITSDQTIDASFVVVDYQITATAGVGGSIAPSGVIAPVNVLSADQVFTITPDAGYAIADVLVNGASVGAVASYTFVTGSITLDQTIDASFVPIDYQITATAGVGGSIAPSGVIAPVNVLSADQVFTITPDAGYAIADVLVNGFSVGPVSSYTFTTGSITSDQTIDASFVVVDYQITATAGAGGSIAPSGVIAPVNVLSADQVFTITPDAGYAIADVLVNGASVGAVASYTFVTGSITLDQTIDASFVVVDYQITATAGAGGSIAPSGVIAPVNVLSADQVFTITPDAGYAIADVLVNGASVGAVASYTFVTGSITLDQTIDASFVPIDYQITATAGVGGSIAPSGVIAPVNVLSADQVFTITPDAGYAIADVLVNGFSVGPVSSYTFTTGSITSDQTIDASFVVVDYQITATAGAGGSIAPSGVISPVNVLSADQVFTITPDAGYAIADVLVNGASVGAVASYTFVTGSITSDQTIDASFVVVDYQITATAGAGGSIAPSGVIAPVNVLSADQVFTITPDAGYAIADVLVNGASVGAVASYTFVTGSITSDQAIDASFVPIDYQITATAGAGGSIAPSGVIAPVNVLSADQVFTITPDAGYAIADVLVNGFSVGPVSSYTFTTGSITSDQTIDASFAKVNYTLTISIQNGNGNVSPASGTTYVYDQGLAVSATPDPGWEFQAWQGDLTNLVDVASQTTNLINPLYADTSIQVRFKKTDYVLTISVALGNGIISPASGITYVYDQGLAVSATPDAGWEFTGWTGDTGNLVDPNSANTNIINPINANTTIQANFAKIIYTLTISILSGSGTVSPASGTTYVYDQGLAISATPDPGWQFDNWTGDTANLANPSAASTNLANPLTADTTIQANFSKIAYVLNISVGSGSGSISPLSGTIYGYDDGLAVDATPNPGWKFVNWTGAGAINLVDANAASTTIINPTYADTVITANFDYIEYTLTITTAGAFGSGTVTKIPDQATYHFADVVTLSAVAGAHEEFDNWTGANAGELLPDTVTADVTLVIDNHKTVQANFKKEVVTLTMQLSGTGTGTVTPSVVPPGPTYLYDYGTVVALTATPDVSSNFSGWSPNVVADQITMDGNQTVTATFTLKTFTVTSSVSGGNGTISPAGTQTIDYGSDASAFTITPDPCHHILDVLVDGVSVGAVSTYPGFTNVTADHSIEATFAIDTFTITTSAGTGGSISPSGPIIANCGTDQAFTITPDFAGGYNIISDVVVDGISQGGGITSHTFINVTADHSISATFEDHGNDCSSATAVALNSTTNGDIATNGDEDFYQIDVPDPGGVLTLYTEYTTDQTDTFGHLTDAGCNEITYNDDGGVQSNFQIIHVSTPGTYFIRVRNYYPDRTGSYLLHTDFETDDHGSDLASATAVSCGTSTAGRIYPAGNWDYFRLDLANPGLITASSSGNEDTYGYLLDVSGSEITHDNDSGSARNFQMERLLDAGTYYIAVQHYNASQTGNYTLDVQCSLAHTLTASAQFGGIISPAGTIVVSEGGSQTFMINPHSGNTIQDVFVDGASVGAINTYTFNNVTSDHTIVATFDVPPENCVDLSDIPLDVKRQGAPANIMFVIDDSGSMDWEFMTTDDDGKLQIGNKAYEYLYDLADKMFKTGTHSDVLSGTDLMYWKSQWSEINKVYYNPTIDYDPWPTLSDADPDTPRSFPVEATPTMDLSSTFYSFDAGIGTKIVDNQDSEFTMSFPEVIVDNEDAAFSKSATPGSWASGSDAQAYKDAYEETSANGNYTATWTPNLPATGEYIVYGRWRADNSHLTAVPYTITHATGSDTVTVNQRQNGGQWVVLGTYTFDQGSAGNVSVSITVNNVATESVCADAVRFVLNDGWDWATDSGALNDHYYWTAKDGTYTVSWTPNMGAGDYNVYAKWVHNVTRSTAVPYTITHSAGTTTVMVDQSQDDGDWYLLGTYSFDAGSGNVSITYTRNGSNDTVCADAIKFVSTSASIIDIKNAHYYVWSDLANKPYLVVVDGGTIRYWEVNDDGDDLIEAGELFETTTPPVDVSTSRSYVDERQNFANWFQYYRKRDLLTRGAIARVITSMQGVQIGLRGINGVLIQPVLRVKVGGEDYTSTLLSGLYSYRLDAHRAATPLRAGLEEVGRYFDMEDGFDGGVGPSPIATEEDGGGCQQNFAVAFTDSYYNGLPPHVSNADGDNGLPYADSEPNTLADVAMYYYENDLADNVVDQVPVNPADDAIYQHMVTYGVTFGVYGTMNPDDYDLENCTVSTCPPWPVPITAQNDKRFKIDDLWHASVNGRGTFMMASNPQELVDAFMAVMQNIESRIGSAASVSVNGDELYGVLDADVRMYQSSYSSDGWIGDVKAYGVNTTTGEVITTAYVFSAATELENQHPDSRIIATYDGSSAGIPFRFNDLTTAQKNLLVEGGETDYSAATGRLNYIRGDTTNELQYGGAFRSRYQRLGDIVHSSPVFEDGVLYAGGNDGMLHAFDASNGRELFAYVPNLVFANLKELTKPTYTHRFYVDLTPATKEAVTIAVNTEITLLVGGLGKGGKGYFALDITDPTAITNETTLADKVMWEYPRTGPVAAITDATNATPIVITATDHGFNSGDTVLVEDVLGNTAANGTWTVTVIDSDTFSLDTSVGNGVYTSGGIATIHDPDADDLGYSYSKPAIVMSNDSDRWLVIFGNGYNSYNGHAVLFIIDAADGTLIKKIDTGAGTCNGLSTPVAIDINADQRVDYVYAGDLKGNMWKFDVTGNISDWDVAFYNGATPQPLFQAKDGINPQPITSKPDVMYHCENDGLMVVFGTGKYLGDSDFLDNSLQTIYGIWDYGDDEDNSEYLGSFERGATPQLSNQPSNVSLLQQTELPGSYFAPTGQKLRILSANAPDWQTTTEDSSGNCTPANGEGFTECDPNSQGANPDPDYHAGWYFDLPVTGERIPNGIMIRDKKAVVIGFIPENTPCGAGGDSYVMEMDACSGGRLTSPQFDINGDGKVDDNDLVALTDASGNPLTDASGNPILVVPTGMMYPGRLLPPAILKTGNEEIKYFSTNVGTIVTMRERGVPLGIIYWLEVIP